MSERFVIWRPAPVRHGMALVDLTGLHKSFRLNNGTPLADGFPSDVTLRMDPDTPKNTVRVDNVLNQDLLIVASARLADRLSVESLPAVEYLPVTVLDHKGRPIDERYVIVHPIEHVDAVDRDASVFEEDVLEPGAFDSFERLVVDESRVPAERRLFRLAGFWDLTLIERGLADALAAEGFSGLRFIEIADFPEI